MVFGGARGVLHYKPVSDIQRSSALVLPFFVNVLRNNQNCFSSIGYDSRESIPIPLGCNLITNYLSIFEKEITSLQSML